MTKPLKPLPRANVDSSNVLKHIQRAVKEVVVPSWITKPPPMLGTKRAGTLKADHWRVLFSIHLPFALISLWDKDSPIAAANADDMASVLDTTMQLVCAAIVMCKDALDPHSQALYRDCLRRHILGLKENFPGFILPSHHLAFHIFDSIDSFGPVRNWWAFPHENLIGRLQRIPTNHKIGKSFAPCIDRSYRKLYR